MAKQTNNSRREFLKAARFAGAGLFIGCGSARSLAVGRESPGEQEIPLADILGQQYDLAGERSQEPQSFLMETRLIYFDEEGRRMPPTIYKLSLDYNPGPATGSGEYICTGFHLQRGPAEQVSIPAMENWSYNFIFGVDSIEYVFGIDHNEFLNLVDSSDNLLDSEDSYWVYNTFIDFHSFCDVFGCKPPFDLPGGVHDLRHIGDSVEHLTSEQEAPVDLGDLALPGSVFKNGKIVLSFKGLSLCDNNPCAIVHFDSGEGSFVMIDKPRSGEQRTSTGSSHYFGDLHIDLDSYWVNKVKMSEFVVSQRTTEQEPPDRFVAERSSSVSKQ